MFLSIYGQRALHRLGGGRLVRCLIAFSLFGFLRLLWFFIHRLSFGGRGALAHGGMGFQPLEEFFLEEVVGHGQA